MNYSKVISVMKYISNKLNNSDKDKNNLEDEDGRKWEKWKQGNSRKYR